MDSDIYLPSSAHHNACHCPCPECNLPIVFMLTKPSHRGAPQQPHGCHISQDANRTPPPASPDRHCVKRACQAVHIPKPPGYKRAQHRHLPATGGNTIGQHGVESTCTVFDEESGESLVCVVVCYKPVLVDEGAMILQKQRISDAKAVAGKEGHHRSQVEVANGKGRCLDGADHDVDFSMFNQQELQILLGGVNSPIDLDDLRRHTQYGGLFNEEEPTIQMFWRVRHPLCHSRRAHHSKS